MFTVHPTLLVGPADWDAASRPKTEFLDRIAAFWRACAPGIAGAVVFGSPRHHAELAYLTHFTPKLEAAVALMPREGAPRLLVGGGPNMIGAAKPLTWVEVLQPLRDAGATIARWRSELGGGLALVNGDAMPFGLRQEIETALGAPSSDVTGLLTAAMRRKRPRELALIRESCATLDAAVAAMRAAQRERQGATDVILAGEQAAYRRGAQDVRTLFGRDGRLAPYVMPDDAPADPLHVYIAVRHGGYWAEAFEVLSRQPPDMAARARLDEALDLLRPGVPHRDIARVLARAGGEGRAHPATRTGFGHSIGLALQEPGCLNEASEDHFAAGEVYTVRVGLGGRQESAIVSAMVAITETGPEVLWPGGRS